MPHRSLILTLILSTASLASAAEVEVVVHPDVVVREMDLRRLLGGNVGLWYSREQVQRATTSAWMKRWRPGLLRLPGGSWGDEIYWNGNGVRDGNHFDASKLQNGLWKVDYSGYRPGFRVRAGGALADYHGELDVKAAHEFVRNCGSLALVTVNAGTGTPEMAAEWVRWANRVQGYGVRYWEVGNELDGKWEQGHFLPGGEELTADGYATRFVAFAKAMKAVDPTIQVGGPAAADDNVVFGDALLRKAVDFVDFLSYHSYPVSGEARDTATMFAATERVRTAVQRLRGLVKQHAPRRADQIEIGITEWHVGVHEGPTTVNQFSGPWCAQWIGRMLEAGVDFANIWDLFSAGRDGGHGVFGRDPDLTPRGAFWAMILWNEEMGGRLLRSDVTGGPGIAAFATRTDRGVSLLLVNKHETDPALVRVKVGARPVQGAVAGRELSAINYLWDEHARRPRWSLPPVRCRVAFDVQGRLRVPPLGALVVHPDQQEAASALASPLPKVEILAPREQAADVPFSAWVALTDAKTGLPWIGDPQEVALSATGPLRLARLGPLTLHRPAGRVDILPTGAGTGTLVVRMGGSETRHTVTLAKVEERPQVLWRFETEADLKSAVSSFGLGLHREEGRGGVARIALGERRAGDAVRKDRLLEFTALPPGDTARVGGVQFQVRTSPDFAADAQARLAVVLQSRANHWVPLGDVKFADLGPTWSRQTVRLADKSLLGAMPDLYAVLFLVQTTEPLKGSVYLDDIGFLLRH